MSSLMCNSKSAPVCALHHPGLCIPSRQLTDKLMMVRACRWYDYQDLIPSSPAAFFRELNGLYIMHGAPTDPAVTVNHAPLDMHALFLAVAQRGGYSAATLQR